MAMNMATQTDVTEPAGPHGTKIVSTPPANAPTPEEIAKFFPQLEIIERLGRGGMGVVYKARQPRLNRLVALKILAPEREKDPAFAGRFEKEAQALARLSHPNIVTVHDFGQAGGMYYLLMEFVDGVTLRQLLNASRVSAREALAIVPQICDALQFAHDHGIVHRDIKPENILLDRLGRVKVADFGLAKLVGSNEPLTPSLSPSDGERVAKPGEGNPVRTEAGKVMGTPQYMAPEQTSHPAEVDHRADIYALGVVFYQMLTGELPGKRLEAPSKKVQIDVRLDEIVMRALEQKPELRYQQASVLKTQVETISATAPKSESQATKAEPPPLSRFQSITLKLVSVLLGGLLVFIGWIANAQGIFFNVMAVFIMLMVPVRIVLVCWNLFFGTLEYRLWRKPLARELRRYWWQVGNNWIFWLLVGWTLELCVVPAQFTPQEYAMIRTIDWGGIAILLLLGLLPGKRIYIATNLAFAIGSIFMATQMVRIYSPGPKTDGVVLAAPFRGEWLVVNGGRSTLINIHYRLANQRDALDLERIVNGQERTGDRKRWTSYPSWGETLYAPADGKIAKAVNNLDDNPLGQRDEEHLAGNQVVIDLGNDRFVLMAHLQKGSVLVKEGDVVRTGQAIAKCGNSGNTSHPHLHLQVQSGPDFSAPDLKTFPILFRDVAGLRAGRPRTSAPFFVRRNDQLVSERIARPSPESQIHVEPVPGFGPVMERVLLDVWEKAGDEALDLRTGNFLSLPKHQPASGDVLPAWLQTNRVDLIAARPAGRFQLVCIKTKLSDFSSERWSDAMPAECITALKSGTTLQSLDEGDMDDVTAKTGMVVYRLPPEIQRPQTLAFQTRDGISGLLQITGFTENPHGVKIRYKLVQSGRAGGTGAEASGQNTNSTLHETKP
jgi:tRNA A-37 threonylcarbamoyl transferase component Bud32